MRDIVIFTSNNARILRVSDVTPYLHRSDCVIDPDLYSMRGIPPHLWILENGKIKELKDPIARNKRERDIETNGADNKTIKENTHYKVPSSFWERAGIYASLVLFGVSVYLAYLVKWN